MSSEQSQTGVPSGWELNRTLRFTRTGKDVNLCLKFTPTRPLIHLSKPLPPISVWQYYETPIWWNVYGLRRRGNSARQDVFVPGCLEGCLSFSTMCLLESSRRVQDKANSVLEYSAGDYRSKGWLRDAVPGIRELVDVRPAPPSW